MKTTIALVFAFFSLVGCAASIEPAPAPEGGGAHPTTCFQTQACMKGQRWDTNACTCVVCFQSEQCAAGTVWDPDACACVGTPDPNAPKNERGPR